MVSALVVICCALVTLSLGAGVRYVPPPVKALFVETFQAETQSPSIHWTPSRNPKYTGEWRVGEPPRGKVSAFPGDKYLIAPEANRYYGLSRRLPDPIDLQVGKRVVIIQFEFRPMNSWDCAGGYIKLFSNPAFDPAALGGSDPYSIMFGPDRCDGKQKVHLIFNLRNAHTGALVEHHLVDPPEPPTDVFTHFYRLELDLNEQRYELQVDRNVVRSGSLLDPQAFNPPLQAAKEIPDPADRQPESWVTQTMIPDTDAVKPADWDEAAPEFVEDPKAVKPAGWDEKAPEYIKDPNAIKPEDWDEVEDGPWMQPSIPNPVCAEVGCGKWLPPRIRNPAFKGKWVRPLKPNPAYQGAWKPRLIPNPAYVENAEPLKEIKPLTAIGIEWWTVTANMAIDNIVIGRNKRALDVFANETSLRKVTDEERIYRAAGSAGDFEPKKPPMWKLAVVGGFALVVIVLLVVISRCSRSPAPRGAGAAGAAAGDKPKQE